MNDLKLIAKIQNMQDIDYMLALLNAHIIKSTGASNIRLGMFGYNKALGKFIKNNFLYMKELSGKAYDKYHLTVFISNLEKSIQLNPEMYKDAIDDYNDMDKQ